jgi:Septum formation initiator
MRSKTRVRWDRLGRVAMLGVAAVLLYLYLGAAISLYSTLREAHRNSAQVAVLERQNEQLLAQHAALALPSTLVGEARQLGMERPGEQPYVIEGLPKN